MENTEYNLVSLSEKDWHYKLVKYTFNIEGKTFKNLCPYFWLMVASLFCVPFVFISNKTRDLIVFIFDVLCNWASNSYTKEYNKYLQSLNEQNLLVYYCYKNYDCYYNNPKIEKLIPKFIKKNKGAYDIVRDWSNLHGRNLSKLENKLDEFFNSGKYKKLSNTIYKIEPKLDKTLVKPTIIKEKDKATFIIKITKKIVGLFISLFIGFIVFLITMLITLAISSFIQNIITNPQTVTDILLACVIIIIVIMLFSLLMHKYFLSGWDKIDEKQYKFLTIGEWFIIFPLYWIVKIIYSIFKFIYNTIKSIWKSIIVSITLFGGIFGEYFGASYSDYCPGIDWDSDKNN